MKRSRARKLAQEHPPCENPVRFIEAFVDGLDLAAAGFARVEPEETDRPGYPPADLLKLYIIGSVGGRADGW